MFTATNNKAEMGVGTLIIFIALLLVAAVAAGVLIQTAGSLQQRALSTGSQATGQISTNAVALEVSAVDGQNGDVENLSVIFKLAPGSDPIKLDDVTFTAATKNTSQTLTYTDNSSNIGTANFGVTYLQTGENNQTGTIVRGDVLQLDFVTSRSIQEGEDVRLNFIPKIGTSTLIQFATPDVMSTQRVYLYP
jgi:archaellin